MKSKISISSKNNDLGGQFKSLDNFEMNNLKGGKKPVDPIPPLPSNGGVDFPLTLRPVEPIPVLVIDLKHDMPDAASNAAVAFV